MWFTVKGILWLLKTFIGNWFYSAQIFWQNWVWFVFVGVVFFFCFFFDKVCRVYISVKTVNFNILKALNFVFDCRIWFIYTVLLLIFSFLIIILDYNLYHICSVCSESEIFSNHLIKLFWCLTVVVGLIKLYNIRIFVFLNFCLTELWSIYLPVRMMPALFGFEV